MKRKRKQNKYPHIVSFLILAVVIGAVLFFSLYSLLTREALRDMMTLESSTVQFLRERLTEYENNATNDQTKSLIRLLDKSVELSLNFGDRISAEEELDRYAYEQRLTGILILDAEFQTVMQTAIDGDTYALMEDVLQSKNVRQIPDHPESAYLIRLDRKGETFDFVAISRRDAPGVIVCYSVKDSIVDGVNDITLDTMFEGISFQKDGIIAISDGKTVVASNRDHLIGKNMEDFQEEYSDGTLTIKDGVARAKFGGRNWYGGMARTKDRVLYVFFPESEVFSERTMVLLVVMACYVILWMALMLLSTFFSRRSMNRLERQAKTISAIGRVYARILLVSLESGKTELLKVPKEHLREEWNGRDIQTILSVTAEKEVDPEYREEYLAFTDAGTLNERLCKSDVLSYNYKTINGLWLCTVIIPQRRDANGNLRSVLYLTRNITEEKMREIAYQKQLHDALLREKRANIAKVDFLRRMSHDIRTPINGIHGMLEIADHFPDDPEKQAECRNKIRQASGFLLDLVNNVLDMNELESGKTRLTEEPFCLSRLLESMDTIAQVQANAAGIRYTGATLTATHDHLIGSPLHLRQVLQNIVGNAIKYNRSGGSVNFSCRELDSDDRSGTFEFICEDTGIGMSEEFQKHAFEPFAQEDSRARTAYSGTGLGLAIVKELVETMGGTIRLESQQGVGTRFTVTLKLRLDSEKQLRQDTEKAIEADLRGTRILLAEDNELNMEIATFFLQDRGATVTPVRNGEEAVDCFRKSDPWTYDCILMDLMMPVMDGLEAARQIRVMDRPDAGQIPMFAMSANAFQRDIELSRQAGFQEHFTKPLDMNVVMRVIMKYRKKQ